MPAVNVDKLELISSLGVEIDEATLENTVFDFGVELDEVYEDNGRTMYKFDVPANRYDLLCLEGMSAALRAFLGICPYEDINITPVDSNTRIVYKFATHERQHIACAIIRGMKFTKSSYNSFISYQDKLHSSIGRNRSIVAIGTHDLSKISGEIIYKSLELNSFDFAPLNSEEIVNGGSLEKVFAKDKKITKFFNLLSDSEKSVAFVDGSVDNFEIENSSIMSIPPIINSDKTKISLDTNDIFVEVTGTDFNKVNTALKLVLYNFRGSRIDPVKILNYPKDGKEVFKTTPILNNFIYTIPVAKINKKLDLNLSGLETKGLLERMMYNVDLKDEEAVIKTIDVRSDIIHECDIIEDVAIAYGFNNFKKKIPKVYTIGSEVPLNKFSDKLRTELALSGYNEVLTLTLLSRSENSIIKDDISENPVVLANPKSKECEVVRTSLLPGILKSIASNLHGKIPIKLFEVSDVVHMRDSCVHNQRKACAVIASNSSLLEEIQGPLSFMLEKSCLQSFEYVPASDNAFDELFLENQYAYIKINNVVIGTIGVLHPKISQKFGIPYACSSFEIDVEMLFDEFLKGQY